MKALSSFSFLRLTLALTLSGIAAAAQPISTTRIIASSIIQADQVDYNQLDHGVYFFGNNRQAQKFVPGQANVYFDRSKKTMIYFHGWQKDSTRNSRRETFDRSQGNAPFDLTTAWRNSGWNVGICYWNQFADEQEVKDAEAKVWSAAGPRAMRWAKRDGSFGTGPNISAGTLCANAIAAALNNFTGSQLRLVGHSLGSQMAINVAQQLSDRVDAFQLPIAARPARVSLLDPAFLRDARPYLNNRWTGEVARGIVANLKANKGVIFESFRSSGSTSNGFIGDANHELLRMTAFTELASSYYQFWQFGEKHEMAVWWYLWSMAFAPGPLINHATPVHPASSVARAPSAATEDYRVRAQMNSSLKTLHAAGTNSKTPQDDTFDFFNK